MTHDSRYTAVYLHGCNTVCSSVKQQVFRDRVRVSYSDFTAAVAGHGHRLRLVQHSDMSVTLCKSPHSARPGQDIVFFSFTYSMQGTWHGRLSASDGTATASALCTLLSAEYCASLSCIFLSEKSGTNSGPALPQFPGPPCGEPFLRRNPTSSNMVSSGSTSLLRDQGCSTGTSTCEAFRPKCCLLLRRWQESLGHLKTPSSAQHFRAKLLLRK